MVKYANNLLGKSKEEILKEWKSVSEEISKVNVETEAENLAELNKRFNQCVEAYYAVDCGGYWLVKTASTINGMSKTIKLCKKHSA